MSRLPMRRRLALVVALLVTVAATACSARASESVTVLVPWTGAEATAFRKVLALFTARTGIQAELRGTRALTQVLSAAVQQGRPPDVAVLPSLGELAAYVRQGAVFPLQPVAGQPENPQWSGLERLAREGVDARYAVAVKADLKSLIWFDPRQVRDLRPDTVPTWSALLELSRTLATGGVSPWCVGMGSTPVSGWPGTDWIEDIMLHQAGGAAYRRWAGGGLAWTSPEVRRAWTTWGEIVNAPGLVRGGRTGALLTDFGDAGAPMLAVPPGCLLHHQASFVIGSVKDSPLSFVPFPDSTGGQGRVFEVSADLAGQFTNRAAARSLMRFLASADAQRIWPTDSGGTVFAPYHTSDRAVYTNAASARIASTLSGTATLCLDASDLMPGELTNAFYRAVLEYLSAPDQLDLILAQLDQVRARIPAGSWLDVPCGS